MAIYYKEDEEKDKFVQPSFVKFNHRFRGMRESYKINSDISAFRFDVHKLYEVLDRINEDIVDQQDRLLDGHSESSNNSTHVGTEDLCSRLNSLSNRVFRLERGF